MVRHFWHFFSIISVFLVCASPVTALDLPQFKSTHQHTSGLKFLQKKKKSNNTAQILSTKPLFDTRVIQVILIAVDEKPAVQVFSKINLFTRKPIYNSPAGKHTYKFFFLRHNIVASWNGRGKITARVKAGKSYRLSAERHGKRDVKIWLIDEGTKRKVAGPVIYKGCTALRPVPLLCEKRLN